ncbi:MULTISPECIES: YeiH family protein [Kytococcus]|nr:MULTISPECIES: putative sulfate exporter family transporter [Kytococcus]
MSRSSTLVPGLVACLVAGLVSMGAARLVGAAVPAVSPLLVAILLGILVGNLASLPAGWGPGLGAGSKTLLRTGIVLLGLQVSLATIADLGWKVVLAVVLVVAVGLATAVLAGRLLGVRPGLALLVGAGFSICGAAAVAAADGVVDAEDEDVAVALALVVLFGTLMIPAVPLLGGLLGLDDRTIGLWAGLSVHEVAQVVAVGGIVGGAALAVAVVAKLARVVLLAPVMVGFATLRRRQLRAGEGAAGGTAGGSNDVTLPPIVPAFVVAFLAMVLVRTWVPLPEQLLEVVKVLQTLLLAAAMWALGTGVRWERLRTVGGAPFALAGITTAVVAAVGLGGALVA